LNVNGDMYVHPPTAAYRALIICLWDASRSAALYNAALDGYESLLHCKIQSFTRMKSYHMETSIKSIIQMINTVFYIRHASRIL
jgi:hypothetical protein